jgi:hypothetical protein
VLAGECDRVVAEQRNETQVTAILREHARRKTILKTRWQEVLTPSQRLGQGQAHVAGPDGRLPPVHPELLQLLIGAREREVPRNGLGVPVPADWAVPAGLRVAYGEPCRDTGHNAAHWLQHRPRTYLDGSR